ncbi:MAG TPA: TIGR00159 family protein [Candidatus Atribacteria bacterium]|nr:TIGR00159 family protein [Candidatus Atribacteria bacterium]
MFHFGIIDVVDILLVAFIFYYLIIMIKDTPALYLAKGLFLLFIVFGISQLFHFNTLGWFSKWMIAGLAVLIPIVFQPELRKILMEVGKRGFFSPGFFLFEKEVSLGEHTINELILAVQALSKKRIGALLVLEREMGLKDIIDTGILINADISSELIYAIFVPDSPLHDGAVVIGGNKILAASCILPLTERQDLDKILGTRHRAGIGVTEVSDAMAIMVSEERGWISISVNGRLVKNVTPNSVRKVLNRFYLQKSKRKVF